MTVKKPVPCSIYDIRGIQEWLDEMALQGLFLKETNPRFDRAEFEVGGPAPVRYRLDPIPKDKSKDRDEPYAEMGWTFVCQLAHSFYIYSCDDPADPELYTDPQSLSMAMDNLVRREIRNNVLVSLAMLLVIPISLFFPTPQSNLRILLLWENPRALFVTVFYPIFAIFCLPLLVFEVRRVLKLRDTLAQGLVPKAKKRRNRVPFWLWYTALIFVLQFGPRLLFPSYAPEVCGLDEAVLSHPWPSIVQTEGAGPRPLDPSPEPWADGYATTNSSWFVPIQEYVSTDWETRSSGSFWTGVQYFQARSPKIAELIYRLERDKEASYQEDALTYPNANRISEVQPFQPWDWPGLDRAELTRYHRRGQDIWTLLLLREKDVLMVEYSGLAQPEDCIHLFLEALDKEVTP